MEIKVIRKEFTEDSTIGEMYIDDKFVCYTLEDKDRGLNKDMSIAELKKIKINSHTATPAGKYRVVLSYSIKLKRFLPLLLDVPLGRGVRIHKGSNKNSTSACILVGLKKSRDKLHNIVEAEKKVMDILMKGNLVSPLYITIERSK